VGLEILVPSPVLANLQPASLNRLAAWADAKLATVIEVPAEAVVVGEGWLIAEVGAGNHHERFAVLDQESLSPGTQWSSGQESALVVRTRAEGPLPKLPTASVTRDGSSLRTRPKGTMVALTVVQELSGPVESFGDRFWNLVLEHGPEVAKRLASGVPLQRLEYVDRYIRTPLMLRLVAEVARGLRGKAVEATQNLEVSVRTVPIHQKSKMLMDVGTNWSIGANRNEVFQTLLAMRGLQGTLEEAPKQDTPHARELSLRWQDGATWRLRLDEGFGFFRALGGQTNFPFSKPEAEQGKTLAMAKFGLVAANPSHLYVLGIER